MIAPIDPADVQRIVLHGYGMEYVSHFALEVTDATQARTFIQRLSQHIMGAGPRQAQSSGVALTVAFTFTGLQKMGLSAACLQAFRKLAPAFCEGAALRSARELGDTGMNDASLWDPPFRWDGRTDVLLSVYGDTSASIDDWVGSRTGNLPQAGGFSGWQAPISGKHLGSQHDRREHFGFRDGISQPAILGIPDQPDGPAFMRVEPGEFLLGHRNEDNRNPWSAAELPEELRDFARNGSFVAFRKMRQDVAAFEKFRQQAGPLTIAKLCGRWPSGALVEPGATQDPSTQPTNAFDFSQDKAGLGCPFGSHIRRLNPRSDPVVPRRKRLIMRRGMPYCVDQDGKRALDGEKGVLGLFICASLEAQFEFLMGDWVRRPPMHPYKNVAAADPLVGDQHDPAAKFEIPGADAITGLSSFVTTKGTLYAFYPSRTALRMMGQTP